jgi:intracellular sulfur oxidation DsrE/DsrF family protein
MANLKLVLHVDQADRWPTAFGNLNNRTRDYPDAEIRVVANGVTFQVRHNALKEHHVEPTALPDFANVVPAGGGAGRSAARR